MDLRFGERPPRRREALAVALAAALFTWSAGEAWMLRDRLRAAREALAEAAPRPAAAPGRSPAAAPLGRQAAEAWSRALRPLNTPWPTLLDALQRLAPANVALVGIEPDGAQALVRLQAEARSLDALLAYAGALRAAPGFGEVTLVRHETREQEPQRPVRLTLDVALRPGAAR
ncbi:PilN domain-containing protein [Ramlibacter sp. MAHUQ-53]